MILQRGKGEYHLKNLPGWPQHILNYSRIDRHASWAFLPKNSPSLGKVTNFFFGVRLDPLPLPPYVQHLHPATLLLALSLRNFMGPHCIVLMYVYTILLRNTKGRSRKIIAGVISQWFWCKYFAHIFILCLNISNKKPPATYTVPKHSCIPALSCWCGLPMLRRKEWTFFCLYCHTLSRSDVLSTPWQCCLKFLQAEVNINCYDFRRLDNYQQSKD